MDLAWLAGLYEGEGNFSLVQGSGHRIMPRIGLINTDRSLIDAACAVLKTFGVGHYIQTRKHGCANNVRHADAYQVNICGMKRVKTFLDALLPFLRGRKAETAQFVLAFVERRLALPKNSPYTKQDVELVNRVRSHNKKGPQKSSETIRWLPGAVNSTRYSSPSEIEKRLGKDIVQTA